MKKIGNLLIAAALCLTLVPVTLEGCRTVNAGIAQGSGRVITQTREVSGIREVVLTMSGTLIIEQTGQESLILEGEDNILPLIATEVSGSRLTINLANRNGATGFSNYKPLFYRLTVKELNYIGAAGSGDVKMKNLQSDSVTTEVSGSGSMTLDGLSAQTYNVGATGSGSIIASGIAPQQIITLTGSGSYNGRSAESRNISVQVSGSGSATVNVSDELQAQVSGSGSVLYVGNPSVTKQDSGSGSVEQIK